MQFHSHTIVFLAEYCIEKAKKTICEPAETDMFANSRVVGLVTERLPFHLSIIVIQLYSIIVEAEMQKAVLTR